MAQAPDEVIEHDPGEANGIRYLNEEEAREYFDRDARRLLGISGEEFLRRLDAGEYDREDLDDRTLRGAMKLIMSIPFGR
jgi:hypothetical protein